MTVRTMLNALLVLQLGLVLLLAATMPEDLSGTDIAELGERIERSVDDGGVDQDEAAMNVAVVEQAQKAAPRRCRKSGKKSVTVSEVEKTEEPEKKDNAATKVAPKKRGQKAAATMADKKEEEEDTEKKQDAKRGRKVTADKEEEKKTTDEVSEKNKPEEAPEVAVLETEVSSSTMR